MIKKIITIFRCRLLSLALEARHYFEFGSRSRCLGLLRSCLPLASSGFLLGHLDIWGCLIDYLLDRSLTLLLIKWCNRSSRLNRLSFWRSPWSLAFGLNLLKIRHLRDRLPSVGSHASHIWRAALSFVSQSRRLAGYNFWLDGLDAWSSLWSIRLSRCCSRRPVGRSPWPWLLESNLSLFFDRCLDALNRSIRLSVLVLDHLEKWVVSWEFEN